MFLKWQAPVDDTLGRELVIALWYPEPEVFMLVEIT